MILLKDNAEILGSEMTEFVLLENGQVLTVDGDRSEFRMIKPSQDGQKGRFSTSALSEDRNGLARTNLEVEKVEYLDPL